MVGRTQQEEGHMRGCQSEKGDGSAVGRNDGCEDTCGKEQEMACTLDVNAQVGGIGFAQQNGIQGLHQQEGDEESDDAQGGEDGHLLHGDAVEVSHSPDEETLDVLHRCQEIQQGDDG